MQLQSTIRLGVHGFFKALAPLFLDANLALSCNFYVARFPRRLTVSNCISRRARSCLPIHMKQADRPVQDGSDEKLRERSDLEDGSIRGSRVIYRVASWNVQSPRARKAEAWQTRRSKVLKQLISANADIVALQEALPRHPEDSLDSALEEFGYSPVHRTPTDEGIEPPVMYIRKSAFEIVWEDCHKRTVGVVLRPRNSPDKLISVLNVHLMGDPQQGDIRILQLRKPLRRIGTQMGPQYAKAHTFIVGDFNEAPGEGVLYDLLTTGSPPDGREMPSRVKAWEPWTFVDAYSALLGGDALATWPLPVPFRRIDFLLVPCGVTCLGVRKPSIRDTLAGFNSPSDHLLITADFVLDST
mmetsp:Transcript_61462/g.116083  ORF Transcript_61462/g.116083 Transcript_61462/m.116083 type:complete len:356 (-) Transcript_61462:480-1547(-)